MCLFGLFVCVELGLFVCDMKLCLFVVCLCSDVKVVCLFVCLVGWLFACLFVCLFAGLRDCSRRVVFCLIVSLCVACWLDWFDYDYDANTKSNQTNKQANKKNKQTNKHVDH